MIFLKSQALDNRSSDLCVIDGVVFETTRTEVRPHLAKASEVRMEGRQSEMGSTSFWTRGRDVSIEIHTDEVDEAARPATVIATFEWAALEASPVDLATSLATYSLAVGRHINQGALAADLARWKDTKKASGSRRVMFGCRRRTLAKSLWLWARRLAGSHD
jgi:hypothetical protein